MAAILFKNENEISNDWLFYIENEAHSLAQGDEFSIQNFMERELFNPEIAEILDSEEIDFIIGEDNGFKYFEPMHLNFTETTRSVGIGEKRKRRFRRLLDKVRGVFCETVNGVEGVDMKDVIKAVLLALIPLFASGIPAALLPLIIGFVAYLMKYGVEKVCPI